MKRAVWLLIVGMASAVVGSAFAADGAATYKAKCAMCHGADGTGNTPMGKKWGIKDLASPDIQSKSDATLIDLTTNGINKMPAFKGKLSEAQISDVVKYLRTFKK
jgi:cytochrome c6